jgi:hypothetical protein
MTGSGRTKLGNKKRPMAAYFGRLRKLTHSCDASGTISLGLAFLHFVVFYFFPRRGYEHKALFLSYHMGFSEAKFSLPPVMWSVQGKDRRDRSPGKWRILPSANNFTHILQLYSEASMRAPITLKFILPRRVSSPWTRERYWLFLVQRCALKPRRRSCNQ